MLICREMVKNKEDDEEAKIGKKVRMNEDNGKKRSDDEEK